MTSRYRQTMAEAMEKVHLSEKEISKLRNGVKVLGNALPNRALAQKMADKANREMGHDADVYHSPFNNRFYVRIKEETLNEKDHEVSMARGELEAISDKALKLSSILQGKSDEGNPLEAWVQSKITKAKDYINSVADYMEYNPDNANEEVELDEAVGTMQVVDYLIKKGNNPMDAKKMVDTHIAYVNKQYPTATVSKAAEVISSLAANEEVEIEEGKVECPKCEGKGCDHCDNKGYHITESMFTDRQIDQLRDMYKDLKGKKISVDNANKLRQIFNRFDNDKSTLEKLYKADIPFVSSMASARLISKHNYKAHQLTALRKEGIEVAVSEMKQINEAINEAKEYTDEELGEMFGNKQIDPTTAAALRAYLSGKAGGSPFPPVREGKLADMFKSGKSASEIAKALGMGVDLVKKLIGEGNDPKSFTKKDYARNEDENEHSLNALLLVKKFGTPAEIKDMQDIFWRHEKRGHITEPDYKKRNAYDKKYYSKLKEETEEEVNEGLSPLSKATQNHIADVQQKRANDLKKLRAAKREKNPSFMDKFKKGFKSEELEEKLKVSDGLGAWIDDFVKSDAPQFDGKSKEKRKDMAIAAFTSAGGKLEQNEDYKVGDKVVIKYKSVNGTTEKRGKIISTLDNGTYNVDVNGFGQPNTYPVNTKKQDIIRKEEKEHPAKMKYEEIAGLKKKAEKSGMPYGILKKVYDRGMAAWRGGHRPGATQQQWAFARVNSFVTKSSGTWGGADKDLAAKVKGE